MKNTKTEKQIDFISLCQFLKNAGFEESSKVDRTLVLCHQDSGTIVTLAVPEDNHTVRPADLLSIVTRLERQGIVSDETVETFRSGKLVSTEQSVG